MYLYFVFVQRSTMEQLEPTNYWMPRSTSLLVPVEPLSSSGLAWICRWFGYFFGRVVLCVFLYCCMK